MANSFICLDIGGSKILGAVMNGVMKSFAGSKKTKPELGREAVDDRIKMVIHELMSTYGMDKNDLKAIGAGAQVLLTQGAGGSALPLTCPGRIMTSEG